MRVRAHDHRRAGLHHLVRNVHVLGPRRSRVLNAPVHRNHQQIALCPRSFYRGQYRGLVRSRRAAGFARIGEKIHVRLIVLVRIPVAVQPARHAQPTHLDSVGLGNHRLPRRRSIVRRAGKLQADLFQMFAALDKSRPPLVHHVVVGKRNNLDPARLQRLGKLHRRVEEERLGPVRVLGRHRCLKIHESKVRALKDVRHVPKQRRPSWLTVARRLGRRAHRLMRNHIARHSKGYLRQVVRIRRDHRRCAVARSAGGQKGRSNQCANAHGRQRTPALTHNAFQHLRELSHPTL